MILDWPEMNCQVNSMVSTMFGASGSKAPSLSLQCGIKV